MTTPLCNTQTKLFHEQGFLLLRNMVPASTCDRMLAVTQDHLARAVAPLEYEAEVGYAGAPASLDSEGGRTARRLRDAWHRDPAYREWASSPQLVAILSQLFGETPCVTLSHHNCIMTKHPSFGTATGWHRDIRYWSFPRNELVSVWLALGHEEQDNGALSFIPGSHQWQLAPHQMDKLDFLRPDVPENQPLMAQGICPALEKGDVVLFHSGLFHAAGRNTSASTKCSVVFAYHGASNPPLPGTRSSAMQSITLA